MKKQVAPFHRIDLYVIFLIYLFYLGLHSARTRTEVVTIFNRSKYLGWPARSVALDNEFILYFFVNLHRKLARERIGLEQISSIRYDCLSVLSNDDNEY